MIKAKAYVTVFFTVTMAVCMSLFMVMFRGIRENALRMRIKEVADISVKSSFAEYQKTLWEKYGLIFVDAGYQNKAESMILTEERHKDCMNRNFDEMPEIPLFGRDLLKLQSDMSEAESVRFATDNGCTPIIRQGAEYMKYRFGIEYVAELYEFAGKYKDFDFSSLSLKDYIDSATAKLAVVKDKPEIKEWTDKLKDAVVEDSGESANLVLALILGDTSEISDKGVKKDALLSHRKLNRGNWTKQSTDPAESLLFKEYLMNRCSDYLHVSKDTALCYEIEYLINGGDSDGDNLSRTALKILLLREAANFYAINNDPQKMEIIRAVAAFIALVLLSPEIAEPLGELIVAVWAYTESLKDVRVLFSGGKVPMIKNGDDFYTDIFNSGTESHAGERGMDYRDYLRWFLFLQTDETLAKRFADTAELNVRVMDNNDYFRLDFCFDALAVTSYVSSAYGYDYIVKRIYDTEVN